MYGHLGDRQWGAVGDFYILCPDNDVPRALDEARILWAAGDIVENRPALSRWHPDHAAAFAFVPLPSAGTSGSAAGEHPDYFEVCLMPNESGARSRKRR